MHGHLQSTYPTKHALAIIGKPHPPPPHYTNVRTKHVKTRTSKNKKFEPALIFVRFFPFFFSFSYENTSFFFSIVASAARDRLRLRAAAGGQNGGRTPARGAVAGLLGQGQCQIALRIDKPNVSHIP